MSSVRISPASSLAGALSVPADKSITHRAIMLAAVSDGRVVIENTLDSEDTGATLSAVEACGVTVEGHLGRTLVVDGVGLRGLRPPSRIDCMNAGTLMRLFGGLLAGVTPTAVELDGDASLRRRPMNRIARPLAAMGASVTTVAGGTPPITIAPASGGLAGIHHRLTVASAQVKSAILLAGLAADGTTSVTEPVRSRDHTELMLRAAGVDVRIDGDTVSIDGPVAGLHLPDVRVPGDFSSAAFHLVAGTLCAAPAVRLTGINLNPARSGLLPVLQRMGAHIEVLEGAPSGGEPYGDLVVHRADALVATEVADYEIPAMIDEVMLVALLGAFASGETVVRGAEELRVKESDRITTTCRALTALGADIEERPDGFLVRGRGSLRGGRIDAEGDHRIAMLGAVAGLASDEGVVVDGFEVAAVSYPGFTRDLVELGATA